MMMKCVSIHSRSFFLTMSLFPLWINLSTSSIFVKFFCNYIHRFIHFTFYTLSYVGSLPFWQLGMQLQPICIRIKPAVLLTSRNKVLEKQLPSWMSVRCLQDISYRCVYISASTKPSICSILT